MHEVILPAMRKLEDALQFAGEGAGKIHAILCHRLNLKERGQPSLTPNCLREQGIRGEMDDPPW
ncbi:hypothetical protein ARNL5_00319 [Anaerolineae bacterium]|nr:hypothetical protein ARNL5_00319 [Anaerolineae bacterium]